MKRWPWLFVWFAGACSGPPVSPPRDAGALASHRCEGVLSGPVGSIDEAVARLKALPPPVTVPCFVASLPRPLTVVATRSTLSAQPAAGAQNPRLFLFTGQLVTSVVSGGAGADLLEFGQWVTPLRTLKGEVELPRDGGVASLDPHRRISPQTFSSTCATCHRNEGPGPDGGFVSAAFRPEPGTEVPLTEVRALYQACVDAADESARCEYYRALFDPGGVGQGAFARDVEKMIQ